MEPCSTYEMKTVKVVCNEDCLNIYSSTIWHHIQQISLHAWNVDAQINEYNKDSLAKYKLNSLCVFFEVPLQVSLSKVKSQWL